ncbi:MAG: type IV pilus secretin PilQ [Xanthomonadales bacterium]|nr:type IV pilus secretin PilQ [Xanthomonadales bacterium]NNL94699.1 type IV pilus secretin PilQ [Xanthomonadales bacterium]
MNCRITVLRAGLGLLLALSPMTSVWADTEVNDASFSASGNGDVTITLSTDGDTPTVSVFSTDNPARIVLDLADTTSNVDSSPVSVGAGAVQSFTTLAAGGRTRVLVDLSRMATYDYSADQGQVVLSISGGGSSVAASSGSIQVENIDFRRGENGQSQVIVGLSRDGANVSVSSSAGRLDVDIFDASLPERLDQRLDVVDFATPVQMIDASGRGNGVRLSMSVNGDFENMHYQSGSDLIIEVSEKAQVAAAEDDGITFYHEKVYTGTRVTFNFQDIPVRSVLQLIADVAQLNIVVADNVVGSLTLRLTNVPWDQALDIVLDARNLDKRENGNVIWIAPTADIANREQELLQAMQDRQELEPLQTILIPVSYASAEALRDLIEESSDQGIENEGLLSDRGSVTIDERTNTLLVTDTPEKIAEIQRLIVELDHPVRQVQIESRIVVASSDFSHNLGVRFGVTANHVGSNILSIAADGDGADLVNPATDPRDDGLIDIPGIPQRYNVNLPAPVTNAGTLGISFLSGDWLLDLELSALEAEGEGEVISTPRIVTANQSEAFIQQGVEIPFEEATSSGASSVQFKEAVLELKATPLITPDNRIQLELEVKQDTVGEIFQTGRGGSVPSIDTRELMTSVLVNNGETIVLGGIFQDEKNRSSDKVPYLSSIPGLGNLFKRKSNSTTKRELLIFVTPTIVEDRPPVN